MYPYVHWSIIYNNQDMEATLAYTNRWMVREYTQCNVTEP